MANVQGKFYRGETQRSGVTPTSPPNAVDEPVGPLNPPGSGNTTTYKQLGDTTDKSFIGKNGYVPVVVNENALTLQPNIPNTGVAVFGGVVFNSTTTVDIGIVKGYIVDNETDPLVSSVQYIEYAGATGVTVTTVGSGTRSYGLLKSDGTIHFQNSFPTSEDRKEMIYLFKVGHPLGLITVVANEPDFVLSPLQQFRDLFQAFNYVNEGVYPYPDAADLTFNTSAGIIVGNGINFVADTLNPNTLPVAASVPCTFVYRTQTGAGGIPVTNIEPNNYDNAGTITTIGGGANRSTLQYIHYSPNLGFVIQYGQTIYDNLVDAIAAIGKETHVVYENLIRDALLIGVLALKRTTTDLTDTDDARFYRADIFGQLVGSAAGTSVTTLQRAYLNSLIPQIETVSGELTIKNGGALDTDVVFAIRDLLDVDNIQMYGNGRIRHADAIEADESATLGQVIELTQGDGLISGGIVQWTGIGYDFNVSAALARFQGVFPLNSDPDILTLTTPDATNDRIDLFILQILFDGDGIPNGMEADFITGTPAATPIIPQINPATQIQLTPVLVTAGSTTPTLTEEVVYDENTEWTGSTAGTGTGVFNSAVDPYQGSVSVETTNIQNGFQVQFNNGSEIDISTYQTFGFQINLKASLGANQNLYVTFLDGSLAPVSNFVLINLNKSLTGYQFIGIALNAVTFTSFDVQYIRFSFVRTSGPTTFSGYFLDIVKLEGGIAPPVTTGNHNQLSGLQGGNASERYHLTEIEHQRVQDFSPYDLAQEGASDGDVLTWVAANSRFEPVAGGGGGTDANAVHYNVADGKNQTERQQARDNIGLDTGIPQVVATTGVINNLANTSNYIKLTGAGAVTLTGIVADTDGSEISIKNETGNILTFSPNNIGSSAGNRFDFSLVLPDDKIVAIKYNGTDSIWSLKYDSWTPLGSGVYRNSQIAIGSTSLGIGNATVKINSLGSTAGNFLILGYDVTGVNLNFAVSKEGYIGSGVSPTTNFQSSKNTTGSAPSVSCTQTNAAGASAISLINSASKQAWISLTSPSYASSLGNFFFLGMLTTGTDIVMAPNLVSASAGTEKIWFRCGGFSASNNVASFDLNGLTFNDAKNIIFNTTTGTKIGTATTQKLAFWNKTPIIQPTTGITAAAFVANTSGIANDTATYGGYTMGQIAAALINTGILA